MKILLCIPNISEGTDLTVVGQVASAIEAVEGVKLINHTSDVDHNRSVFSYLGEPEAVFEASKAMALQTLKLIDMRKHQGEHPRIGAIDVVPFVQMRGVETEEAVDIARRFGRFLSEQGVPVYYYEDAATRPERVNLADVRRGQYEGLADKLQDSAWIPDEGQAVFNPKAGSTAVSARFPLIAFNVNLHTTDIEIANRISKAVRHLNGGFRYVKAIGVALNEQGLVQVSMNLTNYTKTPLPRVLETVRMEAARHGVAVAGTELIGTIPLGAIEEIVRHYVQIHDFDISQIVESTFFEL